MKTIILNREFQHPADGWYQIETPGEHLNEKSGVVQVIDDVSVSSIVNRFNQEADDYQRKNGNPFPGMLIDHEHFKHQADKETRAYGWLMRMENRGGVPFGKINWTATGKPAIDGGDYRFFSSEYDQKDLHVLNREAKPPRVRPMRLDGLSLTNDPNNKGGAAITNRAGGGAGAGVSAPDDLFPTPALDKWFQAVKAIEESAGINANVAFDWWTYWSMAKQQFPDLYAAAFGSVNDSSNDGDDVAAQLVGVANRVARAARKDLRFGMNFIQTHFPAIYNRALSPSNPILNRIRQEGGVSSPRIIQARAANLFSEFVYAEKSSSNLPDSMVWARIQNRHPALAKLANGTLTKDQAFAQEPELQKLLS